MKILLFQTRGTSGYAFRLEKRHYGEYETIDYLGEKCKWLNIIKFLE